MSRLGLREEAALANLGMREGIPSDGGRQLKVSKASAHRQRATRWLWEEGGAQWLPLGGLALLGGREGVGKSTWAYRLAAMLTRGELPGDLFGEPTSVVVAATEDAWEQTIQPRLVAASADLDRISRVEAHTADGFTAGLTLPADTAALSAYCAVERVSLVLLDPLLGTVSGKLDTHKDAEVRRALEPLSRLAHDGQLTVLGLIHQNKGQGGDLLTRLMGSRAFSAVARAVLVCAEEDGTEDDSEPGRKFLFGQEKNNLAARVEHSIRYRIEGAVTGYDQELDKAIMSSRIEVVGATFRRVGEVVAEQERQASRGESPRDRAKKWLASYLTKHGATPSAVVKAAGSGAGHTDRTLDRARQDIGVCVTQAGQVTTWELPSYYLSSGARDVEGTPVVGGAGGTDTS